MADESWAELALASCLAAIEDHNSEYVDYAITIIESWADGEQSLCLVYDHPSFPDTLGLRRSSADSDGWHSNRDPVDFGSRVAFFDVIEPIGDWGSRLPPATDGVRWWGSVLDGPPARPT
jgi:hypothetical protein